MNNLTQRVSEDSWIEYIVLEYLHWYKPMEGRTLPTIHFQVGADETVFGDTENLISPSTPQQEHCVQFLTESELPNSTKYARLDRKQPSADSANSMTQAEKESGAETVKCKSWRRTKSVKKVGSDIQMQAKSNGILEESLPTELSDVKDDRSSLDDAEYARRRESVFGDMNKSQATDDSSSQTEHRLTDYFAGMLMAGENKLTMKLFGSRSALLKEKQRQMVIQTCIIHPCSNFRLYWDLLMLAFLVTNIIVLPVSIAFFFNDMGSHWMIFNIICDSLFLIDIGINFRTGLIDPHAHGEVILDGKTIAIRYLKGWFVVDMFSSLPLDYIFLSYEGYSYTAGRAIRILRLAKLLQLLRLLRISRLVRYVRIWQEYFSLATIVVRIFNLICIMVLLSHWSGCIQFFVPVIQGWPEDSWIARENLQNVHWWEQYTKSLFKALSHMLSIGYGMYPPGNNTDMWLTIASMLAGATCYALFVGHATTLIQSFDTSSRQFRDHLQQVNEYMSYRKLPKDLRRKVTDYYDHKFGGKMFDEQSILEELSHTLRAAILKHNCKQLINNVPFFEKEKDEGNFVSDVLARLKFEMAMPNDLIVKANTRADRMYFIQEGVVKIMSEDGNVVTRLSDGSYFGEVGLLSGQKRVADVKAETYCNLFSLSKDDFDIILDGHPVMRKTIETIAAKRVHTLGKDPAMVSSRESLLEDVTGIHRMMEANAAEKESLEEEFTDSDLVQPDEKQFLNVFKSFFTSDSENFSKAVQRTRNNSRCPSPKFSKEEICNGIQGGLTQLIMVPNIPRRASSAAELTITHRCETPEDSVVDNNANSITTAPSEDIVDITMQQPKVVLVPSDESTDCVDVAL